MASSTYAGIEKSFGISNEVAILTVSLFVMGLGVGPLLLGPVSEFIGRRAVYLWSYVAFLRECSQSLTWGLD
jgi:MFS family permease